MKPTEADRLLTRVLILVGSRLGKFVDRPAGMSRVEVERLAIELQTLAAFGGLLQASPHNARGGTERA